MPVVAVTGGVASGKSTVTAVLESRGAVVIDADVLAREAVAAGSDVLASIAERFGHGILDPHGELDRQALGRIVFSDSKARVDLNAIVHPRVRELYREAIARANRDHPQRVVVYAVPLLAEARTADEFDAIVVVDAPAEERERRLVDHRGFSAEEASARVHSQATDAQRLALADSVLDASGDLSQTERAAHQLYEELHELWPDRLGELSATFPSSPS